MLERVAEFSVDRPAMPPPGFRQSFLALGEGLLKIAGHSAGLIALVGRLLLNLIKLARRPRDGPWRDLPGHLYHIAATDAAIEEIALWLQSVS